MSKNKPLDWITNSQKPPAYLSNLEAPVSNQDNFDETDVSWPGALTELSDEQIRKLEAWIADPKRSLRQILLVLVRAHSTQDVEQRLETAFCAVTNTRKRVGNTTSPDDETILLEMGRLYFARSFGFEDGSLVVGDIAMEAFNKVRGDQPAARHSEESFKRRLRRKFNNDIDRWCFAAAERHGLSSQIQSSGLHDALAALNRLGLLVQLDGRKPDN